MSEAKPILRPRYPMMGIAALNPSYLLAPSLIEPKPVLPPGLKKFGVTRSKTLGVFFSVPCRKPRMQETASRERRSFALFTSP